MLRTRSILWSAALGLLTAAALASPAAARPAPAPSEAASAAGDGYAPSCVGTSVSWRYTFVTNGCDSPRRLTVRYSNGAVVPCRDLAPGETATFPGHGTDGTEVLGPVLCASSS